MKSFCLLLATCLIVQATWGQEVDFEIPTEINIIQGRLSVAFRDGVKEQAAEALIQSLGYSVLQSIFESRRALSTTGTRLTEEEKSSLENDPHVVNIQQDTLPEHIRSTTAQHKQPQFSITVFFQSHISEKEAREILHEITAIPFTYPPKRPNELVVEVGDQDETAFVILQGRDEVKWVTYVGVAGNP